jgi:uncharacterized protein YndB with AHSA1/START domain
MTRVTRSVQVTVNAPLQIAFEYVSDLKRHPEWNQGLRIEERTPGPIAVGKEYSSRGEVAVQKDRPNTLRVSQYEPPHKFAFLARDPNFGVVLHQFKFTQASEGVLIDRAMTLQLNPIIAILFRLLVYPMVGQPSMIRSFAALKAKFETSATSPK